MTQIQLAKELGISKSYLSMILSGQRKCPPKLAQKLSSQEVVNNRFRNMLHTQEVTGSNPVPPTIKLEGPG
jgi:transcriptional regulator with XRE-family HTH domain